MGTNRDTVTERGCSLSCCAAIGTTDSAGAHHAKLDGMCEVLAGWDARCRHWGPATRQASLRDGRLRPALPARVLVKGRRRFSKTMRLSQSMCAAPRIRRSAGTTRPGGGRLYRCTAYSRPPNTPCTVGASAYS